MVLEKGEEEEKLGEYSTHVKLQKKTELYPLENKLKLDLSYDPTIPLLGIYPKDFKTIYHRDPFHQCLLQHYVPQLSQVSIK